MAGEEKPLNTVIALDIAFTAFMSVLRSHHAPMARDLGAALVEIADREFAHPEETKQKLKIWGSYLAKPPTQRPPSRE